MEIYSTFLFSNVVTPLGLYARKQLVCVYSCIFQCKLDNGQEKYTYVILSKRIIREMGHGYLHLNTLFSREAVFLSNNTPLRKTECHHAFLTFIQK